MPISRRDWLALAGAAGLFGGPAHAAESLDSLARAKGLSFGSAIATGAPGSLTGSLADPDYRRIVAAECGLVVPENELKWHVLRPDPRTFDFKGADTISAFARGDGLALRGHTLLWRHPRWFPPWVATHDFGPRPAIAAERMLSNHVDTICRRHRDRIGSWDVVNEAIVAAFRAAPAREPWPIHGA